MMKTTHLIPRAVGALATGVALALAVSASNAQGQQAQPEQQPQQQQPQQQQPQQQQPQQQSQQQPSQQQQLESGAPQEFDLAALQELDDDRTDILHEGLTVDELEDLDVVRDGQTIGEVESVLAEGDRIVALVVDYEDSLPGIGDREFVVPIEHFQLIDSQREIELSLSDDEIGQLQIWHD